MDTKDIEKIMDHFEHSNIEELQITYKDFKIKCKKSNNIHSPTIVENQTNFDNKEIQAKPQKDDSNFRIIKSPIVGTFYRAPSPDSKAYIEKGDVTEIGQTLCIIEAMKMMNELESDCKCKIIEILADIGQLVEFDQPLFKVELI
jgi:acetyl-CoA carboxylase biotin carboxyl carrier protein